MNPDPLRDRTVFFVVGCQKSGTTWLQRLLDAHPQVSCTGESHLADLLAAPVIQLAQQYNARQQRRDHPGHRLLLTQDDMLSTIRHLGGRLLSRGLDHKPHAKAIGDKTPEHALAIPILRAMYPGCRILHIIRDGRDAAISGWAHVNRQGTAAQFSSFADYAAYFAEHHWIKYIKAARGATAELPDGRIEVRYESLQTRAHAEASRLFAFLGADCTDEVIDACVDRASFRSLAGREAGSEDQSSFYRKGAVGDWRESMDDAALERFDSIAGGLLEELGYERAGAAVGVAGP